MKTKRRAIDYLKVGDMIRIPKSIRAPFIESDGCTVREGKIVEILQYGAIAVRFADSKTWDYTNSEALQFARIPGIWADSTGPGMAGFVKKGK